MRWGERPPHSAAARDEDAAVLVVAPREPQQHPKIAKATTTRPALTGTAFGRSVRPGKQRPSAQAVSFPAIDSLGARSQPDASDARPQRPPSAFLVCAGVAVSPNNDAERPDHADERVDASALVFGAAAAGAPTHERARKPAAHPPAPAASALQRSDSELELIINDLREKIALQHRIEEAKRRAALDAATGSLDSSRSAGGGGAELHPPRRHLKNPLERVQSNPAMSMDPSSANLLKRQQSAGCVTRPQSAAHGERLAPPAVVATGITAALFSAASSSSLSRSNLHGGSGVPTSASLAHHSSSAHHDDASLERVYDDEGMLIKSYAQDTSSHGYHPHFHSSTAIGAQRPVVYSSADAKKAARRARGAAAASESDQRDSSFHLELQRANNNASDSDGSSSFGDDDENPFFSRGALSPMGPWVSDAGRPELDGVETHGSPSPLSSARTDDEFAELSPRARLLWFSRCADGESPPSPDRESPRLGERHCGAFRPASAGVARHQRVDGASTAPARCASAKGSHPQRRKGSNNDATRSNRVSIKKRPHAKSSKAGGEVS